MDAATQKLVDAIRERCDTSDPEEYAEGSIHRMALQAADALEAAQRPQQGENFVKAFERFSMGLDSTNRSDAEAGFRAGWAAAQRPPVSPEVREAVAWELSSFLFNVYDHGTSPNAKAEADLILDFLLARWSFPPQPVYDEEKIAQVIQEAANRSEDRAPGQTRANWYAAALVAALRSGELSA